MTGKRQGMYPSCGACGGRECKFLDGEGVLPLYRRETERTLQRYFYLSLDLGRLPSLLGEEVFRARVSSTRAHTFEDLVIFVHDIERRLEELRPELLETIAAIVFLDQSHEEAAASLGLSRRQVERRYAIALDELSRRLLITGLLRPSHASLQERDCEVCLRNPAFTVMDSSMAALEESRLHGKPAEAAVASTELEDSGLPPKKPAASVRRLELRETQPRRAVIVRLRSHTPQSS